MTSAEFVRGYARDIGVDPPIDGHGDVQAVLNALATNPAQNLPNAYVNLSGANQPAAQAILLVPADGAGGALSIMPKVVGAAGIAVTSLAVAINDVNAYPQLLDVDLWVWASNAAGTQSIIGHYFTVGTDHALATLTKADITVDTQVGADLSIPGAAGDPFTIKSTAGGVFFTGAYVRIDLD